MYRDQFANPLDVLPWLRTQETRSSPSFDRHDYIYQSWAYESHDVGATPGMSRDYAKALRAIKAKTLIMTGVKDLLNPEWEPLEAARHIRDVRTVTISRSRSPAIFAAGGFRRPTSSRSTPRSPSSSTWSHGAASGCGSIGRMDFSGCSCGPRRPERLRVAGPAVARDSKASASS